MTTPTQDNTHCRICKEPSLLPFCKKCCEKNIPTQEDWEKKLEELSGTGQWVGNWQNTKLLNFDETRDFIRSEREAVRAETLKEVKKIVDEKFPEKFMPELTDTDDVREILLTSLTQLER